MKKVCLIGGMVIFPKQINELAPYWEEQLLPKIQSYQGVMLAFSGGVDSTVLFKLFCEFFNEKKIKNFSLLHVNYNLRGQESKDDQRFIEDLSEKFCIPLNLIKVPENQAPATGIQLWARNIRQKEFKKWAKKGWIIATAHHQDDICESILMRMARGTSGSHLAGMQEWNEHLWRPLIHFSKAEIAAYAKSAELSHRNDSSNATLKYSRNYIRHEIIPGLESKFPGCSQRIVELAFEVESVFDYVRQQIRDELRFSDKVTLDYFKNKPNSIIYIMINELIANHNGGHSPQLSRSLLEDICLRVQKSTAGESWSYHLPGGMQWQVNRGEITIVNRP